MPEQGQPLPRVGMLLVVAHRPLWAWLQNPGAMNGWVWAPSLPSFHNHHHSDPDQPGQIIGVPVGQSKTAVRFCVANLLRRGSAVNTVAGPVQPDPSHTHGIIGTGRKD